MEIELAKALIWTLRIVLPIILFCIYFKLQSPGKDEQYPGPTKNSYSRGRILARRASALEGAEVPAELASLSLKDQTQAPELFMAPTRQLRGATRREDRRDPRGDRGDRSGDRRGDRREQPRSRGLTLAPEAPGVTEEASAVTDPGTAPTEERMHAEALINYVAFNRKEQQRIFLPDAAGSPPPPPPKPRQVTQTAGVAITPGAAAVATFADGVVPEDVARKANADAQLVLRGAISFKRADVAKEIYEQLSDTKVSINEQNFILMIEACVLAFDLKSASDFLMKMEISGFCPDSNILDRVMDLYSQQKAQNQEEKQKAAEEAKMMQEVANAPKDDGGIGAALEELLESEPRKKLSSGAPIFVPSLSADGLSPDAPVFVPSFGGQQPPPPPPEPVEVPAMLQQPQQEESPAIPVQRTRLTAGAKPFQPQYAGGGFDSYTYTWTPGGAEN